MCSTRNETSVASYCCELRIMMYWIGIARSLGVGRDQLGSERDLCSNPFSRISPHNSSPAENVGQDAILSHAFLSFLPRKTWDKMPSLSLPTSFHLREPYLVE